MLGLIGLYTKRQDHALAFLMEKLPHALYLWVFKSSDQHDPHFLLFLKNLFLFNHAFQIIHISHIAGGPLSDMLLYLKLLSFFFLSIFLLVKAIGWSVLSSQIDQLNVYKGSYIALKSVGGSLQNDNEFLLGFRAKPQSHLLHKVFINRVLYEPTFEGFLRILDLRAILIEERQLWFLIRTEDLIAKITFGFGVYAHFYYLFRRSQIR